MHSAGVRNILNLHCSILEQQRTLASSYEVLMSRTGFSTNWWKLPMWCSGSLTPAAGWPPGISVPCMCSSEDYLILSCASPAACSSCYCSIFQLSNKESVMYWVCFRYSWSLEEWTRHIWDFLGTDFGSLPSSWFQGRDHGLKDSTARDWLPNRVLSLEYISNFYCRVLFCAREKKLPIWVSCCFKIV